MVHADHHSVNSEAVAVLKGLASLSKRPTSRAVAAEAGLDLSATEDILAALAVVGLVEPAGPGRWRAHLGLRGSDATRALERIHEALHGAGSTPAEAPLEHVPETPKPPRLVPANPDRPKQLTEAAHELGVHRDTLDVWAKQGLVPFTWTVGGRRRFLVSEIRAHLNERAAAA